MVSQYLEAIETANWLYSYHDSDFLTLASFCDKSAGGSNSKTVVWI